MTAPDMALLTHIAQRHLHLDTLVTRNADRLDFHEVAVWNLAAALAEAYAAGQANPIKPR